MLCISDSLVCDGIRHCPNGNGYEDDEDSKMCLQFNNNHPKHVSREYLQDTKTHFNTILFVRRPKWDCGNNSRKN